MVILRQLFMHVPKYLIFGQVFIFSQKIVLTLSGNKLQLVGEECGLISQAEKAVTAEVFQVWLSAEHYSDFRFDLVISKGNWFLGCLIVI